MAEKELKIRDFCDDYALDIPDFNDETITLFFNSGQNAENVNMIECLKMVDYKRASRAFKEVKYLK